MMKINRKLSNILLVTMPSTQTMFARQREVSVRGVTCLLPKLHNTHYEPRNRMNYNAIA